MPKYVIERVVPGASKMTPLELKTMSQRSCNVLNELGPQIQWIHSYVTRQQDLLPLPGPKRGARARARSSRRVSGKPCRAS
jgi:hypothetical protein